jgi:hypothetical protein
MNTYSAESYLDSMATREPDDEPEVVFDDEDARLDAREAAAEHRIER